VWVNTYNVITAAAPFGGMKASGWGRENGPEGLLEFSDARHVYVDLAARRAPWFGRGG
jgi:aldehyde dehydrogenase (NAD+)